MGSEGPTISSGGWYLGAGRTMLCAARWNRGEGRTMGSGPLQVVRGVENEAGAGPPGGALTKFVAPEILLGMGALSEIGFAARRMGAVRPLLVSDPGVSDAGWATEAMFHLTAAGL